MTEHARRELWDLLTNFYIPGTYAGWGPGDLLPRYKARFQDGREYLAIETPDSARTLHRLAQLYGYNDVGSFEVIDALFDERREDVLANGMRVIYWPDLEAEGEAK